MGYIAALLSKTNDDVSSLVLKMLEAASPSRGDAYGIASDRGAIIKGSSVLFKAPDSHAMLGYKFNKVMPNDPPQPISQHGYSMIFEGRFWHESDPSDITMAANIIGSEPSHGIQGLIEQRNGSYAIASVEGGRILCGRDPIGVVPLYIGENATLAGVASNRKMLWAVDLVARPFPPGHAAEITRLGVLLEPVRTIRQPQIRKISMGNAVEKLDTLLSEVMETLSRGSFKVALDSQAE